MPSRASLFPLVQPHGHVVTLGAHGPERGIVPVGIRLVLQELLGRFAMLCTHNFPFFLFYPFTLIKVRRPVFLRHA